MSAALAVVLSVLLWAGVALLGLALLLLAMPLHLEAQGAVGEDHLEGRVQARWGWLLLRLRADAVTGVDLRVLGLRVWRLRSWKRSRDDNDDDDDDRPDEPRRRGRRGPSTRQIWPHRKGLARLVRAVLSAIPVRGHLFGTIGLSDPADTAMVFGIIDGIAERSHAIDVDIGPDWVDETVDLDGAIGVRLWPAHVLMALGWQLIRDGQSRRGLYALMRSK